MTSCDPAMKSSLLETVVAVAREDVHDGPYNNDTFVYLTTSEMRTPHYSGHLNLTQ